MANTCTSAVRPEFIIIKVCIINSLRLHDNHDDAKWKVLSARAASALRASLATVQTSIKKDQDKKFTFLRMALK